MEQKKLSERPIVIVLATAASIVTIAVYLTGDNLPGLARRIFCHRETTRDAQPNVTNSPEASAASMPDDGYRPSPLLEAGESYEPVTTAYITTTPRGPLFEILGRSRADSTIVLLGTTAGGIVEESLSRPSLTMLGDHGPVFRGNGPLRIGDRIRVDLALMNGDQYVFFTVVRRGKVPL
jgi:hypothetical protein